jgi:hypothetical protein
MTCNVQCVTSDMRHTHKCRKPAICAYINVKTGEIHYRCIKHEKGFSLTLKFITLEEAIVYEVMNG